MLLPLHDVLLVVGLPLLSVDPMVESCDQALVFTKPSAVVPVSVTEDVSDSLCVVPEPSPLAICRLELDEELAE